MPASMTINKWGHSSGVRIPDQIMKLFGLKNGDQFIYTVHDDELILKPSKKSVTTKEMFEKFYGKPYEQIKVSDLGESHEFDWGEDVEGENIDEF